MSIFDSPPEAADDSKDEFDPYYQWLSIPPAEQPPNHYRLLGVDLFEEDGAVISGAADRQAIHVRSCRLGPYSSYCENILTEIFQAKVCLLDPVRKAEYDQSLRNLLAIETRSSVAQVDIRRLSRTKRSKKKNAVWEVVKIVLGGIGGIFLAILILWYVLGVDPLGVMAPEKPKRSQVARVEKDKSADNHVVEQLNSDLDRARADILVAKQAVDGLRSDNASLKKDLAEKQWVKPREKSAWIDLLSLVDVKKHAVWGTWIRKGDEIVTEPLAYSRISVPIFLDCSYELSIDFTRHTNNESVSVILPVQTTSCIVCLSGWAGTVHGLGFIDGKNLDTWPGNHELARAFPIHNNQRYRLDIQVIIQRQAVSISSQLDKKPLLSWQGEVSRLSGHPLTVLPNRNSLGLVVFESRCTFHRFDLCLLDSTAMVLVPEDTK